MDVIDELLEEKFAQEEGAARVEPQGAARSGYDYAMRALRLPAAVPPREDGRDRRHDPDRRQHRDRARLRLRGRDRRRLVPDHAGDVGDGRVQGVLRASTARDPETGKNNYCILQAEDELAAIGMVIGARWNGARAFTSTAGPGISLMSELIGLAYYAEIPAVIVDVQRTGPSTGMPTRTQQGDILLCAYASHGDTKHILLFPANPEECFDVRGRRRSISPSASRRRSSCCRTSTSA